MYECKCSCHSVCIEEGSALLEMCVLPYKFLLDKTVWHSVCALYFLLVVVSFSKIAKYCLSCVQGILDCRCDQDLFATKHWGTIQAIFLCAEAILASDFKMSSAQERCFLIVLLRLGAARMDDDQWHRKVQCVCSQNHCFGGNHGSRHVLMCRRCLL